MRANTDREVNKFSCLHEADVLRVLAEALTADEQRILANDALVAAANLAAESRDTGRISARSRRPHTAAARSLRRAARMRQQAPEARIVASRRAGRGAAKPSRRVSQRRRREASRRMRRWRQRAAPAAYRGSGGGGRAPSAAALAVVLGVAVPDGGETHGDGSVRCGAYLRCSCEQGRLARERTLPSLLAARTRSWGATKQCPRGPQTE